MAIRYTFNPFTGELDAIQDITETISLDDLSDVDTTGVDTNDFLIYNGSGWVDFDLFNSANFWSNNNTFGNTRLKIQSVNPLFTYSITSATSLTNNITLLIPSFSAPSVATFVLEEAANVFTTNQSFSADVFIRNNGGLIIGNTSQISLGITPELEVLGTAGEDSTIGIGRWSSNASPPAIRFAKSRNTSIGSNTIVQSGDQLGRLIFQGDDGVNFSAIGAEISVEVDGTPGADDMPGKILFKTSLDGSDSVTTRLTIDNAGVIDIPSTSGIDYSPGSDTDTDLITVGVTGTPIISWDESEDWFNSNKGLALDGGSGVALTVDSTSVDVVDVKRNGSTIFQFGTVSGIPGIEMVAGGNLFFGNLQDYVWASDANNATSLKSTNTLNFLIGPSGVGTSEMQMTSNKLEFQNTTTASQKTSIEWATSTQMDLNVGGTTELELSSSKARVPNELEVDGDLNHDGTNIGFYGTAPAAQSAAYTRNATVVEDRTLLASASATTTNNNNVLAALIADLQNIGILG